MFMTETGNDYLVLIVDDNRLVRETTRTIIEDLLKDRGVVEFAEADSTTEAMSVVARLHSEQQRFPDLMVVDLLMPEHGGLDLLKWVRGASVFPELQTTPTIVTTGGDNGDLDEASEKLNAVGILHEPYDVTEIEDLLTRALPPEEVSYHG
jgi:CheY-like chemotaxis protein